jgi:hypothetical protein
MSTRSGSVVKRRRARWWRLDVRGIFLLLDGFGAKGGTGWNKLALCASVGILTISRDLLLRFLVLDLALLTLCNLSLGSLILGSSAFSIRLSISVLALASSGLGRFLWSTALTLLYNGRNRGSDVAVLLALSPKTSDPVTDSGDGDSYKIGLASLLYQFVKQGEEGMRDWNRSSGRPLHGRQQIGNDWWVMHNKKGAYSSCEGHQQTKHICVDRRMPL